MIVPAYGLSRLIDRIPLLGGILTGGEGEGLLAAEYFLDGHTDNPRVVINPLTALAPGFLRSLVSMSNAGTAGEKPAGAEFEDTSGRGAAGPARSPAASARRVLRTSLGQAGPARPRSGPVLGGHIPAPESARRTGRSP